MTELVLSALIGLVVGVGGTVAIVQVTKPAAAPDNVSSTQQEVITQLTTVDLIQPLCSPKYIESNGSLLCMLLSCRQMTRGIDSSTSQKECEAVQNVSNKIMIQEFCLKNFPLSEGEIPGSNTEYQSCINLFFQRGT